MLEWCKNPIYHMRETVKIDLYSTKGCLNLFRKILNLYANNIIIYTLANKVVRTLTCIFRDIYPQILLNVHGEDAGIRSRLDMAGKDPVHTPLVLHIINNSRLALVSSSCPCPFLNTLYVLFDEVLFARRLETTGIFKSLAAFNRRVGRCP